MNIIRKIQYNQNWNIGFCNQTPEELISDKQLRSVRWMKHSYRDRWFADPFIYKVTESEIVVFVEECPIENPKGIICELVIDRKSMRLKERYVLLELDTHLSYPAIIRHKGRVYVYPENGASGKLNIYEYDNKNHKLVNPVCILNEAVADATIVELDGQYYMSATKFPETENKAYLYGADSPFGPFSQIIESSYQAERFCSRQGGNWFIFNSKTYRPAQDCVERYGAGLSIMQSDIKGKSIKEKFLFQLKPNCWRYNLGLHTINFCDKFCVIDGYGFLFPSVARIKQVVRNFICLINHGDR